MKSYNHKIIERKWQKIWSDKKVYKTLDKSKKSKCFILDMFPYPSGEGLHVGHPKGYIATDIYSRYKKMKGFNILHPMGWDAFGLPAENYAIKNKVHPRIAVAKNIKKFKGQLSKIGLNYDWSREINTTDPKYYKWTQWIFLELYKKGLAYEAYEPINWCPLCQTGLANEDLEDGKCERCGSVILKKPMRQWVLKITDYAGRLLEDLADLKWPESIKESQRNWIGKSEGSEISFQLFISGVQKEERKILGGIKVFTTRADTLFGCTYIVLSPEHKDVEYLKKYISNSGEVEEYIEQVKRETEIERTSEGKEKTGVCLMGIVAVNPVNNQEVPVYIADYVLAHYGTGAVMAVPAHDERDWDFAKKFKLSVKNVIISNKTNNTNKDKPYTDSGIMINSGKFDGIDNEKAKKVIADFAGGKQKTTYKLRDWVFSRQRYWGEPIPIIHCEKCGAVPVSQKNLPVKLPEVKSYAPTGTGESPLAEIKKWVQTKCPKCKGNAKRETNTMPQWAGSSWYYLRYIDTKNNKILVDKKKEKYWSPVDMYVGGAEHATRHLIYARFWHKFLFDIGIVNFKEPFIELKNQGLILGEDGRKMSKRWGNVVNPDDVIDLYGADTLRVYEMFMGPFNDGVSWNTESIIGSRRFLEKVWRLQEKISKDKKFTDNKNITSLLQRTIKKVGEDIEDFKFNTAISSMMVLVKQLEAENQISTNLYRIFLLVISPFTPHLAEELWSIICGGGIIYNKNWPIYKKELLEDETVKFAVQINGKFRYELEIKRDTSEADVKNIILSNENIKKWLQDGKGEGIKKWVIIKNRLVNIVI